jgi:hypothetical protein
MIIELTAAQARALADLTGSEGIVALHQVPSGAEASATVADVYATPRGSARGFRIDAEGSLSPIGETLPAK